MKIKHLLLGLAVVAIMASCSKKQDTVSTTTEATPTEQVEATPIEEQQTEAPVQETAKATAPTTKEETTKTSNDTKAPAAKEETKTVDPCEAAVKAYEKYADRLSEASKHKDTPDGLTAFVKLKKQAKEENAKIQECKSNPEYKTRLANAVRKVSNLTM